MNVSDSVSTATAVLTVAIFAAALLRSSCADSGDVTPTPAFIAAALEEQVYAYGGSLDVSFIYRPNTGKAVQRSSRYIKTSDIAYAECLYENGMLIRNSYDRLSAEDRTLAVWPSGRMAGAVASAAQGLLTRWSIPDPVHHPLWEGSLVGLVAKGTVSQIPELVDDRVCWRVSLPPSVFESLTVRVDPAIGYCPRRVEVGRRNRRPTVQPIEFRDYRELAPGVWYPMDLRLRVITRRGDEVEVASSVTSAKIGQTFLPSDLLVVFPSGTTVMDMDTMTEYVQP